MLLDAIPCCSIATEPERILVVGGSKKEDHIVSLNDSDQYVQDSPEESLWKSLELLAKRIIG
ncbi:hypothetical protein KAT92_04925, partial [Candidatus Babeliales bacterium]|nr:hypothetical protein [Candidatus Babeliales bacterium]